MRRRLLVLVAVTTSLVLAAFLVPLALLVLTVASDRATNAAVREAEGLAPLVNTVDRATLDIAARQLSGDDATDFPLTVFLPDGSIIGAPAPLSPAVALARTGRSITVERDDGREVLVAVLGGAQGPAVVRAFVATDQLHQGVARTWLILASMAVVLLGLSLLVAARMARSVTAPAEALADVARRLGEGDLTARAAPDGPPEVRSVADALNLLAERIGQLLLAEREEVADLSHRLRTPLTALRLGVEAIPAAQERDQLTVALATLERGVDRVIREARRPTREGVGAGADVAAVCAERVAFWSALAEDEARVVQVDVPTTPLLVPVSAEDLTVALDVLLDNVFTHTPEGTPFAVWVRPRAGGGAVVVVADEGPGLPQDPALLERGESTQGSTGLGLDIASRTAALTGGEVTLGVSASGGAQVTLTLGPRAGPSLRR